MLSNPYSHNIRFGWCSHWFLFWLDSVKKKKQEIFTGNTTFARGSARTLYNINSSLPINFICYFITIYESNSYTICDITATISIFPVDCTLQTIANAAVVFWFVQLKHPFFVCALKHSYEPVHSSWENRSIQSPGLSVLLKSVIIVVIIILMKRCIIIVIIVASFFVHGKWSEPEQA